MTQTIAIGAGSWGANIVRTLHDLDALAAIVEVDADQRATLSNEYPGIDLYDAHEEALKHDAPAVAIATPAPTHYAIARDAIEAGKDVYVEKPLTLSKDEAESLVQLANEHERVLMVGHLLLYQPAIEHLKDALEKGMIGTVHSLHQQRAKLGRVREVENVLWSFGVHDVAVFLHLLKETPDSLRTVGQRVLQDDVEDDVHLHLSFPSGAKAHLHTSWLWPETSRRLTAIGSEGMLVYDEVAGTITHHEAHIDAGLTAHHGETKVIFEDDGDTQPLTRELAHFLDRVEDRGPPRSPGEQGLAVVDILESSSRDLEASYDG